MVYFTYTFNESQQGIFSVTHSKKAYRKGSLFRKLAIPTNMGENIYGETSSSSMQCNCSWPGCRGLVSRSTFYRHQLKEVLGGPKTGNAPAARPMAVEESFNEVCILITYKYTYYLYKHT
jgi:hypothetical protein